VQGLKWFLFLWAAMDQASNAICSEEVWGPSQEVHLPQGIGSTVQSIGWCSDKAGVSPLLAYAHTTQQDCPHQQEGKVARLVQNTSNALTDGKTDCTAATAVILILLLRTTGGHTPFQRPLTRSPWLPGEPFSGQPRGKGPETPSLPS